MKNSDSKTNHDIQKSIRKAQLESIIGICGILLREKGYSSESVLKALWKKTKNIVSRGNAEEIWLTELCEDLMEELKDFSKPFYSAPSTQIESQIELLLIPQNEAVEKRLSRLKDDLLETTLIEIRLRHPYPPEQFINAMKNGWNEINADGTEVKVDWFNGLCNSFAYELKHNQVVANIFQSQLLANLYVKDVEDGKSFSGSSIESLTKVYEEMGGIFSEKLVRLENQLADLHLENKEIFLEIKNQRKDEVDKLLLFCAMLPDLANQQKALRKLFINEVSEIKSLVIEQGRRNEEVNLFVGSSTQEFIRTELQSTKDSIINAIEHKDVNNKHDGRKLVFLYKRNAHPDEELVKFLTAELVFNGHHVFIDKNITVGIEWAKEIENQIRAADAIICLLSESAIHSEMLAYELQIAYEESQKNNGPPYLIPIRVGYEGNLPSSISGYLDQFQYTLWNDVSENSKLVKNILKALSTPGKKNRKDLKFETTGGAIPIDSNFYVARRTDKELLSAIERKDSIILIKGSRQVGKTSLLARGLKLARENKSKIVLTDFQQLNSTHLNTIESFYITLGYTIAEQLDIDIFPDDVWKDKRSPSINFERYLRREVLEKVSTPVVWGLDEVDRLFSCSYGSEVFGFFRSLHNARALDPDSPWSRLTMAIVYATEAHLFITDLNQSPFNVGTRLVLEDFTFEQINELNRRYGEPLKSKAELERFNFLVGGHPYLVRRGLYEIATQNLQFDFFESIFTKEDGPFGDHLRRFLVMLSPEKDLCKAIIEVLKGHPCPSQETFYRLRSAGLLIGESARSAKLRCHVYETYLRRHLI
ncbi:MAG TPA: AAA-like domain-containing protein [Pyrinomonadaceae bacterium]